MFFGATYYPDPLSDAQLDEDVRMMREAAFSLVRLGDWAWSLSEPEEGQIDLNWLQRSLDVFQEAEIGVLLLIATYATPRWLARKYPEIIARYAGGRRPHCGVRYGVDFTHPQYRHYAERFIRELLRLYARHPAVVGYQLDNETGSRMLHNQNVFDAFMEHLREKFQSVSQLNESWGLRFVGDPLSDWSDLWLPESNVHPSYDLEWRRFQASLTTDFLGWQAGIVREYKRPDQFLTHDFTGSHGRLDADRYAIAEVVDIAAENPYHTTQEDLILPDDKEKGSTEIYWTGSGAWSLYLAGDIGRGARQEKFLVTELNALSIGGSDHNYPAYDGQWRLAAYTLIFRGAKSIVYWPWQSLHYGEEAYWGGVLPHSREPNRCYREIACLGRELQRHGHLLTDLEIDTDCAFLYSQDAHYAFAFQPPCLTGPDPLGLGSTAYERIFNRFYRAFFDARARAIVIHQQDQFERFPLVVAPCLYIADAELLERLVRYAQNGGHLVLTFRSGYADEHGRIRGEQAPGLLRSSIGAAYSEYSNLSYPLPVRTGERDLSLPQDARAEAWADGLELDGAEALAYYDHQHFGRFPAVSSALCGRGRITYVGTVPNPAFARAIADWTLKEAGIGPPAWDMPEWVRIDTARYRGESHAFLITNWSWKEETFSLPIAGHELFSDVPVETGDLLALKPWDAKVVIAPHGER